MTYSGKTFFTKFGDVGVDVRLFTALFFQVALRGVEETLWRRLLSHFETVLFALAAFLLHGYYGDIVSPTGQSHVKTVHFDYIPLDVTIVH